MNVQVKNQNSWIMKSIPNQRMSVDEVQGELAQMLQNKKFNAREFYYLLQEDVPTQPWYKLVIYNKAGPMS